WGGMIKHRGLMCLAIGGNIVTSWSWFGTNMLGVGLHSYGFTDAAFVALTLFVLSQLAIIALGNLPLAKWRSFRVAAPPAPAPDPSATSSPAATSPARNGAACARPPRRPQPPSPPSAHANAFPRAATSKWQPVAASGSEWIGVALASQTARRGCERQRVDA